MKKILTCLCLCLTCLLSSCCLKDWYHDLRYGNEPLPTDPIAPAATQVPGEFSEAEALSYVTDDLIFFLSTVSTAGLPSVFCGQDLFTQTVCRELLRSRVIQMKAGSSNSYRLSAEKKDGKYIVALYSGTGKCEYSRMLKLKTAEGKE